MGWLPAAVATLLAILVAAPAHASEEQTASNAPFSVHLGLGSQVNEGGNVQSLSLGYTPERDVTVLVNVERDHVPSQVRTYPGGGSETRGGTAHVRQRRGPLRGAGRRRVSPFFLAGLGAAASRGRTSAPGFRIG
jgi:hypothetical protein